MADASDTSAQLISLSVSDLLPYPPAAWRSRLLAASLVCGVIGLSGLVWSAYRGAPTVHASAPRTPSRLMAPTVKPGTNGPQAAGDPPTLQLRSLSPAEAFFINARTPNSGLPINPAAPFRAISPASEDFAHARDCLTAAVYYEAALESTDGQRAVAQVVLNRVRHPAYPKTVCGVVYQGSERATGCQFTFTCDGSLKRKPVEVLWRRAEAVAEKALRGDVMSSVGLATHYHTVWVVPYWSPTLVKIGRIGAHIFYRWTGGAASAAYAGSELDPNSTTLVSDASAGAPAADATTTIDSQPVSVVAAAPEEPPKLAPVQAVPREEAPVIKAAELPQVTKLDHLADTDKPRAPRLAVPDAW